MKAEPESSTKAAIAPPLASSGSSVQDDLVQDAWKKIEPKMRALLPADLYAAAWIEPAPAQFMRVFQHLRTLQRSLNDYVPRQVVIRPPKPGVARYARQKGTLLFTDLAGFTPLLEANAAQGRAGALALLEVLNRYFSEMIEIISKSGGDLLEFTGDAMLVQFLSDTDGSDTAQAVRAGLRMQRAMVNFQNIQTAQGSFSLEMRVGIHAGGFLAADIGTPLRMVHVLLGETVQRAKRAEGAGRVGRVCLTRLASDRLQNQFQLEALDDDHVLITDNLTSDRLGEYDLTPTRHRLSTSLLMDRSAEALLEEIQQTLQRVEPLASYIPAPILNLMVESTARRRIDPNVSSPVVIFINLAGSLDVISRASDEEMSQLISRFSSVFAQIHAIVQSRGGILQKITYHSGGSEMLVYFGALGSHSNDVLQAASTALAIRKLIEETPVLTSGGGSMQITCRIGMDRGAVFAAEIGEQRGRREFNILGDPVNTAARLMVAAQANQILLSDRVHQAIQKRCDDISTFCYDYRSLGEMALKGKASPMAVYTLV